MGSPYLAEIRLLSFNFPPKGWAMANGQFLPLGQNQALFSLLGTVYGGNGQTTFALPDLRGRTPIHFGAGFTLGEAAGETAHTVNQSEMPQHTHFVNATSDAATLNVPTGNRLAAMNNAYAPADNLVAMSPSAVSGIGGSQAHTNMQPYLVMNFCIALQGEFPSQN